MFFYQDSVNFRIFDKYKHNYTITSRQAVTEEINLNTILDLPSVCRMNENLEQQRLLRLLEFLDMQKLVVSVYNLSSILSDVGDRTVELEISEVL